MRAQRDCRIAYQAVQAGSVSVDVWPYAGSGIAYRLANMSAPRWGVLTLVSALFYLV
jgi:hypothetical protein